MWYLLIVSIWIDMKPITDVADGRTCCPPIRIIDDTDVQVVSFVCRLFDDRNRLRIFASLRSGERCVQDIGCEVGLPQNLVSHHLSVLREAGLVKTRRVGHRVCYSVNKVFLTLVHPSILRLFDPGRVNG